MADAYRKVAEQVAEAALRVGRRPEEIKIVAVSKGVDDARIREAVTAGARILGENRVQEAQAKMARLADLPVAWHLVGHLQTNKVKYAVKLFACLHSLDSVRLAEEIQRRAEQAGRVMPALVEVNVSGEATKFGVPPRELRPLLEAVARLPLVKIEGLMTMAPVVSRSEEARPYFQALRRLAEEAAGWGLPGISMRELSMGMTQDFPVAVEEGATLLRIGTAIFGARA